jgi:hypothetical protein
VFLAVIPLIDPTEMLSKDPDVFWLPVRLLVKVEFAVYSLSFELIFMNDNI